MITNFSSFTEAFNSFPAVQFNSQLLRDLIQQYVIEDFRSRPSHLQYQSLAIVLSMLNLENTLTNFDNFSDRSKIFDWHMSIINLICTKCDIDLSKNSNIAAKVVNISKILLHIAKLHNNGDYITCIRNLCLNLINILDQCLGQISDGDLSEILIEDVLVIFFL